MFRWSTIFGKMPSPHPYFWSICAWKSNFEDELSIHIPLILIFNGTESGIFFVNLHIFSWRWLNSLVLIFSHIEKTTTWEDPRKASVASSQQQQCRNTITAAISSTSPVTDLHSLAQQGNITALLQSFKIVSFNCLESRFWQLERIWGESYPKVNYHWASDDVRPLEIEC